MSIQRFAPQPRYSFHSLLKIPPKLNKKYRLLVKLINNHQTICLVLLLFDEEHGRFRHLQHNHKEYYGHGDHDEKTRVVAEISSHNIHCEDTSVNTEHHQGPESTSGLRRCNFNTICRAHEEGSSTTESTHYTSDDNSSGSPPSQFHKPCHLKVKYAFSVWSINMHFSIQNLQHKESPRIERLFFCQICQRGLRILECQLILRCKLPTLQRMLELGSMDYLKDYHLLTLSAKMEISIQFRNHDRKTWCWLKFFIILLSTRMISSTCSHLILWKAWVWLIICTGYSKKLRLFHKLEEKIYRSIYYQFALSCSHIIFPSMSVNIVYII